MPTTLHLAHERLPKPSPTERGFLKIIQFVTPKRMKRLILYASLTALLKQQAELDRQTLEKLNEVMRLSTVDIDSMRLPVYLRAAIWRDIGPIEIPQSFFVRKLTEQEIQPTLTELLRKIPKWLRYGNPHELREDASHYLQNCSDYLSRRLYPVQTARA